MPSPALPILYSFRRCPYAMRARLAIAVSAQHCELREVVLRNKPAELLAASAKATVPVLLDAMGSVIDESLDIMRWALEQNDPQAWLAPERGTDTEMRQLIAHFDDSFKHHLDRYKYPNRFAEDGQDHRAACAEHLSALEARLLENKFLFGAHATLADMAVAPFVRQFARTDETWFKACPCPQLQSWLAAWEASALFAQVMEKYAAWKPGFPPVLFPPDTA